MSLSGSLKFALSSAAIALCAFASTANAADREFALVFKVLNNAFSPPIDAGCKDAAKSSATSPAPISARRNMTKPSRCSLRRT